VRHNRHNILTTHHLSEITSDNLTDLLLNYNTMSVFETVSSHIHSNAAMYGYMVLPRCFQTGWIQINVL
jgi:hypothetical protein